MLRPGDIAVRDVMSTRVISLAATTSLAEAASQLLEDQLSGAPVVGEDGSLLGVISAAELLSALIDGATRTAPVRDLAQPAVTCGPEVDITEACRLMVRGRVHCMLVLEDDKQVGVFSAIDTVRTLACLGDPCLQWDPVTQTIKRVEQ